MAEFLGARLVDGLVFLPLMAVWVAIYIRKYTVNECPPRFHGESYSGSSWPCRNLKKITRHACPLPVHAILAHEYSSKVAIFTRELKKQSYKLHFLDIKHWNRCVPGTFKLHLVCCRLYLQGFLHIAFTSTWITDADRRQELNNNEDLVCILRNDANIHVPFARLSFSLKQPLINIPKLWTEFNAPEIKILRNKLEFNLKLKEHLLSKLSSTVNCSRMLCPACHLPV